jgi:hypothetical protein
MSQIAGIFRQPLKTAAASLVLLVGCVAAANGAVLQVGTYQGIHGHFSTIQAAVNAAKPGDWILIAPGDYHERGYPGTGVWIVTPGIHVRGMDRNGVFVDGTLPGAATCSSAPKDQDFGQGAGLNGVVVYQVDGVSVENLTVCNFLGDNFSNQGNQIWWNGGDGSGVIGMGSYHGAYLTATSTYFDNSAIAPAGGVVQSAQYGIFVSNSRGPGVIEYSYASNMSDSSFYIGACPDCNAVLNHVHAQNSAQGFSGSNSGGHLVLENSEWDHNQSGIVPSSLAIFDLPSPQNGACPNDRDQSCTLIQFNFVHDNNNPNTPASGLAATSVVGSGINLTGGRNNTVQYNVVTNNGSWGVVLNDYADYSAPVGTGPCVGGQAAFTPASPYDQLYAGALPIPCYFRSFGNRVVGNVMWGNGSFGNETNGDLGNAALPFHLDNCFSGNVDLKGGNPTASPSNLPSACGRPWSPNTQQEFDLTLQLGCASSVALCGPLPPNSYPRQTLVKLLPNPRDEGMENACTGVPANSWCP